MQSCVRHVFGQRMLNRRSWYLTSLPIFQGINHPFLKSLQEIRVFAMTKIIKKNTKLLPIEFFATKSVAFTMTFNIAVITNDFTTIIIVAFNRIQ